MKSWTRNFSFPFCSSGCYPCGGTGGRLSIGTSGWESSGEIKTVLRCNLISANCHRNQWVPLACQSSSARLSGKVGRTRKLLVPVFPTPAWVPGWAKPLKSSLTAIRPPSAALKLPEPHRTVGWCRAGDTHLSPAGKKLRKTLQLARDAKGKVVRQELWSIGSRTFSSCSLHPRNGVSVVSPLACDEATTTGYLCWDGKKCPIKRKQLLKWGAFETFLCVRALQTQRILYLRHEQAIVRRSIKVAIPVEQGVKGWLHGLDNSRAFPSSEKTVWKCPFVWPLRGRNYYVCPGVLFCLLSLTMLSSVW